MADTKINPHYQTAQAVNQFTKEEKPEQTVAKALIEALSKAGVDTENANEICIILNKYPDDGWNLFSMTAKINYSRAFAKVGFSHTRDEEQNTSTGVDIV